MNRRIEQVLAQWREAERLLAELDRDTADYIRVRDEVDALAHEYRGLVDDRQSVADELAESAGDGLTLPEAPGSTA